MLVRLLLRKQIVLFTLNGERLYLFYHGKVYTTTMQSLNAIEPGRQLPNRKSWSSKVFIWTLFDIENRKGPEMLLCACQSRRRHRTQSVSRTGITSSSLCMPACHYGRATNSHKVSCLSRVSFHIRAHGTQFAISGTIRLLFGRASQGLQWFSRRDGSVPTCTHF